MSTECASSSHDKKNLFYLILSSSSLLLHTHRDLIRLNYLYTAVMRAGRGKRKNVVGNVNHDIMRSRVDVTMQKRDIS